MYKPGLWIFWLYRVPCVWFLRLVVVSIVWFLGIVLVGAIPLALGELLVYLNIMSWSTLHDIKQSPPFEVYRYIFLGE